MRINKLHLTGFRIHRDTTVAFRPGMNVIYGPNGAGKTNLLEATHYLCLGKSFLASRDTYVLQKGAPFFELRGHFHGEQRPDMEVRLVYMPDEGKRIFLNRTPLERLAGVVGMFPVVVISPEDAVLTAGGPEERRRFLDNTLSQAHPVYLDDLMKYRRVVRQRNVLLQRLQGQRMDVRVLDSWDEELVRVGSRVIYARKQFLQEFTTYLAQAYAFLQHVAEEPSIRYRSHVPLADSQEAIQKNFLEHLHAYRQREIERGKTLVGPHRDELVFYLHAFEVRRYASQGQHRTFSLALKLAKYFYLKENLHETPLLLLDDILGNLDPERKKVLLEMLQQDAFGQSLITTTSLEPLKPHVMRDDIGLIEVKQGKVTLHAAALPTTRVTPAE